LPKENRWERARSCGDQDRRVLSDERTKDERDMGNHKTDHVIDENQPFRIGAEGELRRKSLRPYSPAASQGLVPKRRKKKERRKKGRLERRVQQVGPLNQDRRKGGEDPRKKLRKKTSRQTSHQFRGLVNEKHKETKIFKPMESEEREEEQGDT